VKAREGAESELRQLKEEMRESKTKVIEIMEIARCDREWEFKSVVVEGESLEVEQQLHRTDPDIGLLNLLSTIKSSSKSYRLKNDKLA
jgi:hypothetical protein